MKQHRVRSSVSHRREVISALKAHAIPLNSESAIDHLIDRIGDAGIVMLGEASHGTHEYYTWRTHISERLIREKGFNFICVEGDWPDCYLVNRYIKLYLPDEDDPVKVLRSYDRWPTWMWGNWEVAALADMLYGYNKGLRANERIGFYGLDVYSLWESIESIMHYLERVDPSAMKVAEDAIRCFEPYREDEGRGYAKASQFVPELCQAEVIGLLSEIRRKLPTYNSDHENVFSTEQNALVAVNAEKYYREMIRGGPHSWNLRDRHMADTLERLLQFHGPGSKAIVWAHNTHIGDARATDMAAEGMYNIGELARLKHHDKGVVLVGFGSYEGNVIAGRSWGAPMRRINMPPATPGSWEEMWHAAGGANGLVLMEDLMTDLFMENHIGHRAIGVVYNPEYEQYGNYVPSIMPLRYDAFIFLDQTKALHPIKLHPDGHLVPETYPFGV